MTGSAGHGGRTGTGGTDLALADWIEGLAERLQAGAPVDLEACAREHPEWAERIGRLLPAIAAMADLGLPAGRDGAPVAPADASPVAATGILGDFRIVREVGRGGMGVVYEAQQISLNRRVALKILPLAAAADPRQLRRFQLEAQAAACLHHTHIVPVHAVGCERGVPFYAMQFIDGSDLATVIAELRQLEGLVRSGRPAAVTPSVPALVLLSGRPAGRGAIPGTTAAPGASRLGQVGPDAPTTGAAPAPAGSGAEPLSGSSTRRRDYIRNVAEMGVQVAEALDQAHTHGILHRDIKPANLLLDARGQLWVTDFGLAQVQGLPGLTMTGDVLGTLRYMSPEQALAKRVVIDGRTDVYSLGVTLYELLTLQPAFDGRDRQEILRKIADEEPAPPRRLNPAVPRDLETILLKAIAKEPDARYATAKELAEDLRKFLEHRTIMARRPTLLERAGKWALRHAAVLWSAAAALVAVAAISVVYATRTTRLANDLKGSLAESNRLLAIRNFDRGQASFEQEQIGPGLLWMIECWRSAVEAGDPAWQHAARANLAAWQPYLPRLQAVLSHPRPVDAAIFRPDGRAVLTGGDDGAARLWDVATGEPFGPPIRHAAPVLAVAFSPDAKAIFTGCLDGTARLWDAATGMPLGPPLQHEGMILSVAVSPDGKALLTGSEDKTARLWEAASGKPLGPPIRHALGLASVAFSPDGKALLTGSHDRTARLWDAASGAPLGPPLKHEEHVLAVAFGPGGKTVFTGCRDGTVRRWDAATGTPLGPPRKCHSNRVREVAISGDGQVLLTGSTDKTARLWDAATGMPLGRPVWHQGPVVAVAFSADSRSILTASSDGTARLWEAAPYQSVSLALEHRGPVLAVAFGPRGKALLTGCEDGTARLWDVTTGRPLGHPLPHHGPVVAVAVSRDGRMLLTGSRDGMARRWDAATGTPLGPPLRHQGEVSVVAFSPDGKALMTGSQDHTVRLWDAATGTPLGGPLPQPDTVDAGAFRPDGTALLIGYAIGEARLWDVATRTPLGPPFPHPGAVSAGAFRPDGKAILTGCEDGTARYWDVATRTLLVPPLAHQAWVWDVAFSPDGQSLLTGSSDGTARLWDAATGSPLGLPFRSPRAVLAVGFSPDGQSIVVAGDDSWARLLSQAPELPDDLDRIALWVEILTGLTLDPRQGSIGALDRAAWLARRERLERQGGPPVTAERPLADPVPGQAADRAAKAKRAVELHSTAGASRRAVAR